MGNLLLMSCIFLAMSSWCVILSPAQSSTSSSTSSKRDGNQGIAAHLLSELTSIKGKQLDLDVSLLTAKTELEATKTELQTMKTELQTMKTEIQTIKTERQAAKTERETMKTELQATKTELQNTEMELGSTKEELQAIRTRLESKMALTVEKEQGSSFVRWGRKSCPINTSLVYVGVAGGKHYDHKGGGTNTLCLTRTPQFDNTPKPAYYGYLYGAEYDSIPGHHNHDVPCSVCLAPQSSTIMVPATLTCPTGWTLQYTGHLVSDFHNDYATEYVCLDGSPENDSSGVKNDNGLLFYYVVTVCGSLPCPPYANDKVVTCVVCSK